jgi:hypothetical protein
VDHRCYVPSPATTAIGGVRISTCLPGLAWTRTGSRCHANPSALEPEGGDGGTVREGARGARAAFTRQWCSSNLCHHILLQRREGRLSQNRWFLRRPLLPHPTRPVRVQNPCPEPASHDQPCRRVVRPSGAWATCSATPAPPPPTSSRACRSTRFSAPAATRVHRDRRRRGGRSVLEQVLDQPQPSDTRLRARSPQHHRWSRLEAAAIASARPFVRGLSHWPWGAGALQGGRWRRPPDACGAGSGSRHPQQSRKDRDPT